MTYLIKLLKTAKAYRKAFKSAWDNDPMGNDHAVWNDLENKEHDLLDVVINKGRKH